MLFTVDCAKQCLLSKVSAQAAHDGVSLDESEKRMFLFSEVAGHPDYEANEIFEGKYDDKAYELMNPYAHDKRTKEGKQEWTDALAVLNKEDFYGLVMVDQAGIPRNQGALRGELWRFELQWLPFEIIELLVIILGFLIVFRPSVLRLYLPDWVRWLAYPLFAWLAWYIGRVWGRMQTEKAMKRSTPRDR